MPKDYRYSTDRAPDTQLHTGVHCIAHSRFRSTTLLLVLAATLATLPGCHPAAKLPDKSSKEYGDVVSAFYVGLAALQVGDDVHAESKLSEVTRVVPAEPAGWANWGILALRQRNY